MVLDTTQDILRFHMLTQLHAIRLEGLGIRHSKGSVLAHVKRSYNLKGNRASVINQLDALIKAL